MAFLFAGLSVGAVIIFVGLLSEVLVFSCTCYARYAFNDVMKHGFCQKCVAGLIGLGCVLIPQNLRAFNLDDHNQKVQEIAAFLRIVPQNILVECKGNDWGVRASSDDAYAYFCLSPQDTSNRCEISLMGMPELPAQYNINMDIRQDLGNPSDGWHTVMQIHSTPDEGEEWRCAPFSIEAHQSHFRVYSRWDESQISRTVGYNCAEAGGSIRSREVLRGLGVKYGEWESLNLRLFATPYKTGLLDFSIGHNIVKAFKGGNAYNDKAPPFIKLGIYKPAGWSKTETRQKKPICVGYKNVRITHETQKTP